MKTFRLLLIKPSHYHDDGYVIRWWRSAMPANTLAAVVALAEDAFERGVLGDGVRGEIRALDETNTRIRVAALARWVNRTGGIVGLVGVQSNQFPRAMDLARAFIARGVKVAIGGFHVSGSIAMLDALPPELVEARSLGITLFAGEAEGQMERFLRDAHEGRLEGIYDFMDALPDIGSSPIPFLSAERVQRTAGGQSSFDAGRGCPFSCSFCTIINVQGRKSRYRSAEDIALIVKRNLTQGVKRFFITDDNFARNELWEPILDRLIRLREEVDIRFNLVIQVDTLCHRIPGFVDKCVAAGVKRVFIGLENINPANLKSAKKRQNRITEYRTMLQAWKDRGVFTIAGYILGFPDDTPESILRDIAIIKRELPIDLLEFFYLTPLPGSEDHKNLVAAGATLEPDFNRYDLCHACMDHPNMARADWDAVYRAAWASYYDDEHCETLLRRGRAKGVQLGKLVSGMVAFPMHSLVEGVHPLEAGVWRRKSRSELRPGLRRPGIVAFWTGYVRELVANNLAIVRRLARYHRLRRRLERDPATLEYTDLSLTPASSGEIEMLEIFTATPAARAAAAREFARRARLDGTRRGAAAPG